MYCVELKTKGKPAYIYPWQIGIPSKQRCFKMEVLREIKKNPNIFIKYYPVPYA